MRLALVLVLAGCATQSMREDASFDAGYCFPDIGHDVGVLATAGCPCDTPGRTVCGSPNDFVCSGGVWAIAADVCGELDAGAARDAGSDAP